MAVNTKTATQLLSGFATAVQARASGLVDFSIGSIMRAMGEATRDVVLWLQGLILTVLAITRAATSTGSDLDTWMADYGLTRLASAGATGTLVFGRTSATNQVVVPIGATAETSDGSVSYAVTVDVSNPAYNGGLGGYVMPIGTFTVSVPAACVTNGLAGNAIANFITVITSAIPGVSTVNNPSPFSGGSDAETDAAFRARFQAYLLSLREGTVAAVIFAATSVQAGMSAVVVENATYAGNAQPGFFYVVVDDGTGAPGPSVIAAVVTAVEPVRPVGSTFAVYGPTLVTANIALNIGLAAGYLGAATAATVQAAITAYINALGMGGDLLWSRLIQVAYDASPGVASVTGLTINGTATDLIAAFKESIKTGTCVATVI